MKETPNVVKKSGDTMTGDLKFTSGATRYIGTTDAFPFQLMYGGIVLFNMGGSGGARVDINAQKVLFPVQAATASAPSYVKGGLYFDTTLNKLRIGGAAGWETITSA